MAQAQLNENELVIQRSDRQNAYRFGLDSLSDALRAEFITQSLLTEAAV